MSNVRFSAGDRFVELYIEDSRLTYDEVQKLIKKAWCNKYENRLWRTRLTNTEILKALLRGLRIYETPWDELTRGELIGALEELTEIAKDYRENDGK